MVSQVNIQRALTIGGWMSEEELTWLASCASQCKTVVEFGSFHGRSTMALADNIQEGGRVYAVDPWNGDYTNENGTEVPNMDTFAFPYFRRNLEEHIRNGVVIPSRAYSQNFRLPFKVDMIFIDGDHKLSAVVNDIRRAEELVRPGGIISGHDYGHPVWPGVKQAVDAMYGTDKIKLEGCIWWTRKL